MLRKENSMQRRRLNRDEARLGADTLRMLAVDAVEEAGSGHPGLPMGAADYAFILWHDFLCFNPSDPEWPNRDRFILSAGHGSMLLYGLLHLFGFGITMDEIRSFRKWGSRTPGHPEYGVTPGVEVTTGPLGQGFANGVGMALAARMSAERFNDAIFKPMDHRIYAIVSDGDLMEGISYEAASLAGHLKLGELIYIYDDNRITIEGETGLTWSESVRKRFVACGWHVQAIDGHDFDQIGSALETARSERWQPSLIIARTRIAKGSPGKEGSPSAHGAPLGPDEAAATRKNLKWPEEKFHVPASIKALCHNKRMQLKNLYSDWEHSFVLWRRRNPDKARLWDRMWGRTTPGNLAEHLLQAVEGRDGATRTLSGMVLQQAAQLVPALAGGSADLEPSTNTRLKEYPSVLPGSFSGRNIHFGIREHAMAAMMNGMARYGCFIPFGGTFLVFSDYCRPAIRLAALMGLQVVYVFTHDSFLLGEDGPTHQPVEQAASLRLIPNLMVIRPGDGVETAMAWTIALERKEGPTAILLSRQKLPAIPRQPGFSAEQVKKGGYLLLRGGDKPDATLMASGSETPLAVATAGLLKKKGVSARVVSVPCLDTFLAQPLTYRRAMIPGRTARVAIEAGRGEPWRQLVGQRGLTISIEHFGASAPAEVLASEFGFTPEKVADSILSHMKRKKKGTTNKHATKEKS
jgi:transketolase